MHRGTTARRLAVGLVLVLGACKDPERTGDTQGGGQLSHAGFRQADDPPSPEPEQESEPEPLPPEKLWSPKDLGVVQDGKKKGECFPRSEKDYSTVLARAGDLVVRVQDFTAIFHAFTLDATKSDEDTLESRRELVQELIDQELLALAARRKGYESTQVGELLEKRELAEMIRKDMRRQAIDEMSDESYKKYYKSHPEKYMIHPDQRKVVHVIIKGKKAAQKLISRVVYDELSLEAFMKEARALSLEPDAKETSGRTEWFDREGMGRTGRVVPENVGQAAFKLKDEGDVYRHPLPSSRGWHVIMLLSRRSEKWIPFYKVRSSIAGKFVSERQDALVEKLLDTMKKNHPVTINMSVLERINAVPCL
jgi:parvulin-like peptidyl-prolyl isomerase